MRKLLFILLLLPLLGLGSCLKDTSAYLPQSKEDVAVDSVKNEEGKGDDESDSLPEGKLVPGIHLVKLNVKQPDGQTVERRFKYYMPISIDETKPISLIFEFHGSYTFDAGVTPDDPLADISLSNPLIQTAIQENYVVCFPAGTVETQSDGSGAVNWQYSEKHLPFVDAMIAYFKSRTPAIDPNRIYSTGQSSGAIFSFVLAFERSEVFAAVTPRAGQMSLQNQTQVPPRAVPIRLFAGTVDDIVQHASAVDNMTAWAEKIGGYFASDMVEKTDSFEIDGYKKVDTRIWSGGKADYQIYSLEEEGHGISLAYCLPYMWEFMASHTLDGESAGLYVNAELKNITAQVGQTITFGVNYTDGAVLTVSQPKGWGVAVSGKSVRLTAPRDFYGAIERKGTLTVTASLNGKQETKQIPFALVAPKDYFEVGDVYYDSNFQPIGIVCWVNDNNIKEAAIVNLQEVTTQGSYQTINFGDFGTTFTTPSLDDGEGNTAKHMAQRQAAGLEGKLTAASSGLVWAATYTYKGVGGWYLPALNELKAVDENLDLINAKLEEVGGEAIVHAKAYDIYLSSSVTLSDGSKCFNLMNFNTHASSTQVRDNTSYCRARAFKKVTK